MDILETNKYSKQQRDFRKGRASDYEMQTSNRTKVLIGIPQNFACEFSFVC